VAADGRVRVYEANSGALLSELHHKNHLKHKPTSLSFAPTDTDIDTDDVREKRKNSKKMLFFCFLC
jgi:hypothetical protein